MQNRKYSNIEWQIHKYRKGYAQIQNGKCTLLRQSQNGHHDALLTFRMKECLGARQGGCTLKSEIGSGWLDTIGCVSDFLIGSHSFSYLSVTVPNFPYFAISSFVDKGCLLRHIVIVGK